MRYVDFTLDRDPARGNVYRDPSHVGLNVLAAFDFATLYGRPGGPTGSIAADIGVPMANYVDYADDAVSMSAIDYDGNAKALLFDAADNLSLGNDFLLPTTCTDFIVYFWARLWKVGADGFNNRVLAIRQGGADVFSIVPGYTGTALSYVEAIVSGAAGLNTILSDAMKAALVDNKQHLFAFHVQSTGTNWRVRHFLDGKLDQEKPFYARPAIPAKVGADYGYFGRGNAVNGPTGNLWRAGLINMTGYSARSADSIIRQQWRDNYGRLAALV